MKICTKCKVAKPLSEFHRRVKSPDGLCPKCKPCAICDVKKWADANKDRVAANKARWRNDNATTLHERAAASYAVNKDAVKAKVAQWRKDNPERFAEYRAVYRVRRCELVRFHGRKYARNNLETQRAHTAARRARKANATPKWANLAKIRELYAYAARISALTGERYHVDHIVPLRGKTVCGLHNEFNLQILRARENQSKGNRQWPQM